VAVQVSENLDIPDALLGKLGYRFMKLSDGTRNGKQRGMPMKQSMPDSWRRNTWVPNNDMSPFCGAGI